MLLKRLWMNVYSCLWLLKFYGIPASHLFILFILIGIFVSLLSSSAISLLVFVDDKYHLKIGEPGLLVAAAE